MKDDFYNNEERQYKDLIEVLKELPKIKAPDNFEYNLMTRITNKNFNSKSLLQDRFTVFRFLKPGLAVAVSAVLIFFIVDYQQSDTENPLLSQPKKRTEISNSRDAGRTAKEFVVTDNNIPSEVAAATNGKVADNQNSLRVVIHDNDVIAEESRNFPFPDNSFDLDSKLKNDNNPRSLNDTRVLAGSGTERVLFEGFYTGTPFSRVVKDTSRNRDTVKVKISN